MVVGTCRLGRAGHGERAVLEPGQLPCAQQASSNLDPGAPLLGELSIDRWLSVSMVTWSLARAAPSWT